MPVSVFIEQRYRTSRDGSQSCLASCAMAFFTRSDARAQPDRRSSVRRDRPLSGTADWMSRLTRGTTQRHPHTSSSSPCKMLTVWCKSPLGSTSNGTAAKDSKCHSYSLALRQLSALSSRISISTHFFFYEMERQEPDLPAHGV